MIDIKAIREVAEEAVEQGAHAGAVVIALCDEVERLRKDATRYQWLRSHPIPFGHGSLQVFMDDRCGSGSTQKQVWDSALDAAIDKHLEKKT